MEHKKRNFFILVLLLAVFTFGAAMFSEEEAVYEDTEEEEEAVSATVVAQKDFFSDFRLNRDRRRDAEEELYQSIMLDPTRSEEAKMEAEASLTLLYRISSLEDRVESILIGRDYNDVIFSVEENMSLLMIRKETIDEKEKASLIDFVSSYGGIPAETISVFSVH